MSIEYKRLLKSVLSISPPTNKLPLILASLETYNLTKLASSTTILPVSKFGISTTTPPLKFTCPVFLSNIISETSFILSQKNRLSPESPIQ